MILRSNLIDIPNHRIFPAEIEVQQGKIQRIQPIEQRVNGYILPGFVDAHVHIESSMLVPSEFARLASVHGTVATVSDPHEIANVLGAKGVLFMLENARKTPMKCCFGAPSCVPATSFETAGAVLNAADVEALLQRDDIYYLSEMMNFPGVLFDDPEVMAKIAAAKKIGKPVDGHAPGLRGKDIQKYFSAGISTDHECFTYAEGLEKLQLGMKLLIREGSAARNFNALIGLLPQFPEQIMFCSDDKHPDDLIKGHINQLVVRALEAGCELFDVLKAACINPVEHYKLPVGQLRVGDPADFILVQDIQHFSVQKTYINGKCVAKNGQTSIKSVKTKTPNQFRRAKLSANHFKIKAKGKSAQVIVAIDGEIVTGRNIQKIKAKRGHAQADQEKDLLKIAVINRYKKAPVSLGLIQGFGIKDGAIASCVAHDSHNIVVLGTDDELMAKAANLIFKHKGGISAVTSDIDMVLPLPVAGIMTNQEGSIVAERYTEIDNFVHSVLKSPLRAPFMTLSFMALPVIPALKMTDLGLFDVDKFGFTELFMDEDMKN